MDYNLALRAAVTMASAPPSRSDPVADFNYNAKPTTMDLFWNGFGITDKEKQKEIRSTAEQVLPVIRPDWDVKKLVGKDAEDERAKVVQKLYDSLPQLCDVQVESWKTAAINFFMTHIMTALKKKLKAVPKQKSNRKRKRGATEDTDQEDHKRARTESLYRGLTPIWNDCGLAQHLLSTLCFYAAEHGQLGSDIVDLQGAQLIDGGASIQWDKLAKEAEKYTGINPGFAFKNALYFSPRDKQH